MAETEQLLIKEQQEAKYTSKARQYAILLTVLFLQFSSIASDTVIFPFFPSVARERALTMTQIGAVLSAYDLSRFVFSPVVGSLLVKWSPKNMCIVGAVISAAACAAFGTAKELDHTDWFLALCVGLRVIAGVGSSIITVASTSIMLKTLDYSSSTIIGVIELVMGFGYAVGPAIGAALHELTGYVPMFWIFGGLLIASLPIFIIFTPKISEERKETQASFLDIIAIPGCLLMFLHCTLTKVNGSSRTAGISDFITDQLHQPVFIVGVLFGIWSLFYIIGCAVAARLTKQFQGWLYQMMISAWFIMSLLNLLVGPSTLLDFIFAGHKYIWLTAITMVVINIVMCFMYIPPFQAALNIAEVRGHERDSLHTYGMITGLINSGLSLGSTTGPLVSGAVIDALGFEWSQTCLAFIDIFMGVLLMVYYIYMSITNQALTPAVPSSDASTKVVYIEETTPSEQVARACQRRMENCLKDSAELTTVHKQQPETK